jgi:hypothetical protein
LIITGWLFIITHIGGLGPPYTQLFGVALIIQVIISEPRGENLLRWPLAVGRLKRLASILLITTGWLLFFPRRGVSPYTQLVGVALIAIGRRIGGYRTI